MRRTIKLCLILMVVLTVLYVCALVYASFDSSNEVGSDGKGKYPREYGIWRAYFAQPLDVAPPVWNTTEELGITIRDSPVSEDYYSVLIVDLEKALPWMMDEHAEPYAYQPPYPAKHEDKYYYISFLWATPGIDWSKPLWPIPAGGAVTAGWLFTGILYVKKREG